MSNQKMDLLVEIICWMSIGLEIAILVAQLKN